MKMRGRERICGLIQGLFTQLHCLVSFVCATLIFQTKYRYFNEASLRLDSQQWSLMKQGQPKVPTIPNFLSNLAVEYYKNHGTPFKIGIDPYVHSASFAKELQEAFDKAAQDMDVDDSINGDNDDNDVTAVENEKSLPVIGEIDTGWETKFSG